MKSIAKLSVILLAAAALVVGYAQAQPAPAEGTTNTPSTNTPPRRTMGYGGTILTIDSTNMVLELKGRGTTPGAKVKVTSSTKIMKDRQPATFSDLAVGLRVRGSGKKDDTGVWIANTLNIFSPPPAAKPPATTNTVYTPSPK